MTYTQGDVVMADKGLEIHDLHNPVGVTLNIPLFLGLQDQMPEENIIETQHGHMERAINKVRNLHIFERPIPLIKSCWIC